jgi:hypothetical protein
MPENERNTVESRYGNLIDETISEKKKEIKSLRRSLKQEQNRVTELRENNAELEAQNRVLNYRIKNNIVVKIFEILFSSIFGLGLGTIFIENMDLIYKVIIIMLGLIGTILIQFVNGKE